MWEADYTSIDSYRLAVIYLKSIEHINSLCTEIKFYFIRPCHLKLERYMFVRVTENFRILLIFVKIWASTKNYKHYKPRSAWEMKLLWHNNHLL